MADIVVNVDVGEGKRGVPLMFNRFATLVGDITNSSVKATNKEVRKFIIRSAKARAPKWSGYLARSIKQGSNKDTGDASEFRIVVGAPYAAAQEFGYTPHFVPWNTPTGNPSGSYGFVWQYMKEKGILGSGIIVVRNKPFMRPALLRASSVFAKKYGPEAKKQIVKHLRRGAA